MSGIYRSPTKVPTTMPRKLASLTLILAFALAPALISTARAEVLNRVVLRINDQIATLYDYQQHREELVRDILHREQDSGERQRLLGQTGELGPAPPRGGGDGAAPQRLLGQTGELAYADLFRELLLQSRADQLGVEVTE